MKTPKKIRVAVALMACVGMLSPAASFGAMPTQSSNIKDTKLAGDALVGKVVDAQGNAVASAQVAVRRAGQNPKVVATNARGEFSVAGLNGGVYQVSTQGSTANYRVWTANAAPPVAAEGVLLVDTTAVVTRGQCGPGGCANSAPAYGGGAVYGAPVQMASPVYGGGGYGGGEVVVDGGGGGCGNGGGAVYGGDAYGGGAGYPVDAGAGYPVDAGAGYVVDGGYGAGAYGGGACAPAGAPVGGLGGGGLGLGGGGGGFLGFLSSPWVIGAGVAAAIAIPLALDDDDDDGIGAGAGDGTGNGAGNDGGGAAS